MPEPDDIASHLRKPMRACRDGRVPANIALMRLCTEARSEAEVHAALDAALRGESDGAATARLRQIMHLLREHPAAFATVKAVMSEAEHSAQAGAARDGVAHWAAVFDRLARAQPEAGVALYSLGSPDILDAATRELVEALSKLGLLRPESRVLEIGCGIGRIAGALAPRVRDVLGTDVSAEMIRRARERCAGLPNVAFAATSGHDLGGVETSEFDLCLAVDVFPYLVLAGDEIASRHVAEAARVLRPGGALAIFNYSYRGQPDRDHADLERSAERAGFAELTHPELSFAHWDGTAFLLRKG